MSKRLYIGNISYKATASDLEEFFSQAGEVVSADLVTDKITGKLRGFGFVEMATAEAADKAMTMLNGKLFKGRNLVVNLARPKESRGLSRATSERHTHA